MCRLCDWGELFPRGGEDPASEAAARTAAAERQAASQRLWAELMPHLDPRPPSDDSGG